jgi:hypothetical protein
MIGRAGVGLFEQDYSLPGGASFELSLPGGEGGKAA